MSRLTDAIDPDGFGGLFGSRPVLGRVTESSLCLRKRINYRNSSQRYLTATIQRDSAGTIISGKVAIHPVIRVLLVAWFGTLSIMFLSSIGSIFSASTSQQHYAWRGAVISATMLAFGYAVVHFGYEQARDEGPFLTDFLIKTLDAHEQN